MGSILVPLPFTPDNATLEVVAGVLRVKDLGIGTAKIAANAIGKAKLNADVADGLNIAGGAGAALSIVPASLTLASMADGAIQGFNVGGSTNIPVGTNYAAIGDGFNGAINNGGVLANGQTLVASADGKLIGLTCVLRQALNAGKTLTLNVVVNGADVGNTVQFVNGDAVGTVRSAAAFSVAIAKGDVIQVKVVNTEVATARQASWSVAVE